MVKFGSFIAEKKVLILIVCIILLIPSVYGIINTRINYDMLTYLPKDMDTVKGQDILLNDFGKGAFSIIIVNGMKPYQISQLRQEIEKIDNVASVISYDSLFDVTIPLEILPDKYREAFNKDDETLMAVFFDSSTSADETIVAIQKLRQVTGDNCFVTGMSALVTDLKELCEREEPIYVGLAVILATIIMMIFLDSWILPFIFLANIGIAVLYNLGTNIFIGEISYITKALSAVLQLAVTMDYSIFLWHSYCERKSEFSNKETAMAQAISDTFVSLIGSSSTTIAGFLALCFMSFTLGFDLGLVMAKGVLLGVICCITTLPATILVFDKALEKTMHKPVIPKFKKFTKLVVNHPIIFFIVFVILAVPAYYGNRKTEIYYDIGGSLPRDLDYVIANTKLEEDFDMASTHMLLVDSHMSAKDAINMLDEIKSVDGVKVALGFNSLVGSSIPEEIIPDSLKDVLKSDKYQLMLISSKYKVASDEVNAQIENINSIVKKYDKNGMLIGEAPCTKDMISVTDHDFKVVNAISIAVVFVIIAISTKSLSLPILLVSVIEFAVFVNLGIPYYSGVALPFIAPICISTIQLGSTVDYAILMTTRYKKERMDGKSSYNAALIALRTSMPSIIVSALGFFAATYGVGLYSDIDMISSMCSLMARGAILSMVSVVLIVPSMFRIFDKIICKTTIGMGSIKNKQFDVQA